MATVIGFLGGGGVILEMAIGSLIGAIGADDSGEDSVLARFRLIRGLGDIEGAYDFLFEYWNVEAGAGHEEQAEKKILATLHRLADWARGSSSLEELRDRLNETLVAQSAATTIEFDLVRLLDLGSVFVFGKEAVRPGGVPIFTTMKYRFGNHPTVYLKSEENKGPHGIWSFSNDQVLIADAESSRIVSMKDCRIDQY